VLEAKAAATGTLPPALENRPELEPELEPYFEAFALLSPSRPLHMGGAGAIPVAEIKAYLDIEAIADPDDRRAHLRRLRAMDETYLAWAQKRAGSEGEEKGR
jgi:hypothetical protein